MALNTDNPELAALQARCASLESRLKEETSAHAVTKELLQEIEVSGTNGDQYDLVLYNAAKNVNVAANPLIVVRFEQAGALVNEDLLWLGTGTYLYTNNSLTAMATGDYDRIIVYAPRMTGRGRVFIDDVSLIPH